MRNLLESSSAAQSLDVRARLKGSLRFPYAIKLGGACLRRKGANRPQPVGRRHTRSVALLRFRAHVAARRLGEDGFHDRNPLHAAWGSLRAAGQTFTGYRQLIDELEVNPNDDRSDAGPMVQ